MEIERALRERRSIRAFTDEPVADATIRELLEVARWAPSWANTQGSGVIVVRGAALERIAAAFDARAGIGAERRFDLPPLGPEWPPPLRARMQELLAARERVAGGASPAARAVFFGAPCMVYFTIDEAIQAGYACFDLGLLVQSFCLAAHGRGLGTCIMARAVAYPDLLRELLPQARGRRFVVGVALGVPDRAAPVNGFERQRATLDELASWVSE
jgi:nitroreductase